MARGFGSFPMTRRTGGPAFKVLVLMPLLVSLGMRIVIVALGVGVIGIVIIGRGVLVVIITGVRVVPPISPIPSIRRAGRDCKQKYQRD